MFNSMSICGNLLCKSNILIILFKNVKDKTRQDKTTQRTLSDIHRSKLAQSAALHFIFHSVGSIICVQLLFVKTIKYCIPHLNSLLAVKILIIATPTNQWTSNGAKISEKTCIIECEFTSKMRDYADMRKFKFRNTYLNHVRANNNPV